MNENEWKNKIDTAACGGPSGLTILPKMVVHFDVSRERSVAAVERPCSGIRRFFGHQKHPEVVEPDLNELIPGGTMAVVKQLVKLP